MVALSPQTTPTELAQAQFERRYARKTQEQNCDPAFDAWHIRDGAGGGSRGHTGQGDDEQQQAYKA
jgi:hypothetical protein